MHRWRARVVERRYRKFVEAYGNTPWPTEHNLETLGSRIQGSRFQQGRKYSPLKTLWVGTDYAQDSSGFIQALGRVTDLSLFTQANGQYGYLHNGSELSFRLVEENSRRLEYLLQQAKDEGAPYDLLMGQFWAGYVSAAHLGTMRSKFGLIIANVAMDDRHTFDLWKVGRRIGTKHLAPHIDLALTAAPESVAWYQSLGTPALFFPEASDPAVFTGQAQEKQDIDVCFVGANYGIRNELVEALERERFSVVAYGSGWERGRIPTPDVPGLFRRSKIVLGVGTIGSSRNLVSLKLRDFDAPMSGSCYVTQYNSDLEQLYELDAEIVCYRSISDCVEKVRYLLNNEQRRGEIGRNGQLRAISDHTWDSRFNLLLSALNEAKKYSNSTLATK